MAKRNVNSLILLNLKDPPELVEESHSKHLCVHCKSLLRPPVKMLPCGHRICYLCLRQLIESGGLKGCTGGEEECSSTDLTNESEIYPDYATERELKQLLVYCFNRVNGCPIQIQWKNLDEHLLECIYKTLECPFRASGCSFTGTKLTVDEHLNTTCPYVEVTCEKCGDQMTRKGLKEHDCGTPRPCVYSSMGCTFQGTLIEVRQHINNDHYIHLDILANQMKTTQDNIKKLTVDILKLSEENNHLKEEINQFTKQMAESTKLRTQKTRLLEKVIASTREELNNMDGLENQLQQVNSVQAATAVHEDRIRKLEACSSSSHFEPGQMNENLPARLQRAERSLQIHTSRIEELNVRFQNVESAIYDGVLIWKIGNYWQKKESAKSGQATFLYSQPFYTSQCGYKMVARIYLNGDGLGKGTHLSLFIAILKGPQDALLHWPFSHKVSFYLLDQDTLRNNVMDMFHADTSSSSFQRPVSDINVATGCPLFAEQSVVESNTYLKENCIYVKIVVDTKS